MTCNAESISSSLKGLSRFTESLTVDSGNVWACADEKAPNKAALNSVSLQNTNTFTSSFNKTRSTPAIEVNLRILFAEENHYRDKNNEKKARMGMIQEYQAFKIFADDKQSCIEAKLYKTPFMPLCVLLQINQ